MSRTTQTVGCLGVLLLLGGATGAGLYASSRGWIEPLPIEERCVVSGSTGTVTLTPEQARLAMIIAGRAVTRGLGPRAVTIALATAYQESGIRNLDHGDRDSLGIFQQRPSKGWGTPAQIRDPGYSADAFYDRLVKVPGWESADINDTAQTVQRSGHPQAYRKHEGSARVLAEVLTGHRAAGVSCVHRSGGDPDPQALAADARRTFPSATVNASSDGVRMRPRDETEAWRLGAYAAVNGPRHGLRTVRVGSRTWRSSAVWPGSWSAGSTGGDVGVSR